MPDAAHEVMVPCDCGDIEACRMELYVSDVRLLLAQWDGILAGPPSKTLLVSGQGWGWAGRQDDRSSM